MNDNERKQWVQNDDGLYNDWRASRLPLTVYVRAHREWLDTVIQKVITGNRPAHFLAYGGVK